MSADPYLMTEQLHDSLFRIDREIEANRIARIALDKRRDSLLVERLLLLETMHRIRSTNYSNFPG